MKFVKDTYLAERYQVDRCTPWRWAKKGTFPQPVRLSGGVSRWNLREVEAHEKRQAELTA